MFRPFCRMLGNFLINKHLCAQFIQQLKSTLHRPLSEIVQKPLANSESNQRLPSYIERETQQVCQVSLSQNWKLIKQNA